MSTLYEEIGGESTVGEVVTRFYGKVLADKRLAGFFHEDDMEELSEYQTEAFTAALGGPGSHRWELAKQLHQQRGIYHEEYDLVIGYLADALHETEVADHVISETLFAIAPLARDVISTAPSPT
ncbi:hemoglobin [Saccharopolyspora lacisalsi]|uniref:Hemoglobin n=1 Tax=Halosaccharopolyspora lacisalsi TaxID=1000566 RepID=A0A839DSW3_9PSEU|nr:group 1 truncated hemoglobin [Halosaccharopolyspora lacisalsi]MBA8824040.1 hemoglobin [Halosaccharopolyspora lacisalsi]